MPTFQEKVHTRKQALYGILSSSHSSLPIPLIDLIAAYTEVVVWKLASSAPRLCAPIERLNDFFARRERGRAGTDAFIQGDTPLSSGRHAWRVTVKGLNRFNGPNAFGVAAEEEEEGKTTDSIRTRSSFYGMQTAEDGVVQVSGGDVSISSLVKIRNGEQLDFLLEIGSSDNSSSSSLTVISLKDDRRCVLGLPPGNRPWVPHFLLQDYKNEVRVEVIEPERAGEEAEA